jgi:PAS domain S-box-containing protein
MTKLAQTEKNTIKLKIQELEQKILEAEAAINALRSQDKEKEQLLDKNAEKHHLTQDETELLAAVIQNSPVGIAILAGTDLIFRFVNHLYRAITPDPQIDPNGRKWKEIWPGINGFQADSVILHVLKTGETINSDHHTRRFPDGSLHHYSFNLSRIIWNNELVVLCMLLETTPLVKARNKAENALQEQNQLLAALRKSEERFRTSVDNLPEGYAILSAVREPDSNKEFKKILDFRYEYINDTGCQLLQIPREKIVGHSLLSIQPEAKESSIFQAFVELIETGQPLIQENLRYKEDLTNDSRLFQVFDTRAVKLGDGFVMTWRDVTDRVVGEKKLRKTLQALQESERRLELAHQAAGLGSWNWKFGDSYATCSETFFQVHGLKPPADGKLDLEQYLSMIHPSDAPRVRELTLQATQVIDVGTVEDNEFRFIKPNGPVLWMAVYQKAVHEGDTLVGISGVTMDITNRKRAERKIQRSEQHLRNVLNTIFSFVGVLSPEGVLLEVNKAPLEAAGITFEDVQYKRFEETYWWNYSPEIKNQLRNAIYKAAQGESSRYDVHIKVKDNKYNFMDFMIAPMFDGTGKVEYLIPSAVDITARKETEDTLQQYAERLERSNRELEQFAFIASHDLQEPLRKIQMFSKALLEHPAQSLDSQQQDFIARMDQASVRMRTMITDLLDLSRVTTQAKPFITLDLNATIAEAVSDLEERITQSKGKVHISKLATIQGDPGQMKQLFQNLISNALKFHRPNMPPVVEITSHYLPPNTIQVMVADNGIGFDSSQLESALQPFRRLVGRSQYEGSGIGLAICRKIVERHGGSLTAESTPGEGSVFMVTLPLTGPFFSKEMR